MKVTEKVTGTSMAPRKIYKQMVLGDSVSVPRDLKQVKNRKYLENKKARCPQPANSCHANRRKNTADDIITLLDQVHEHPFIQEVIQTKGNPPSVIMYLKEQLDEI